MRKNNRELVVLGHVNIKGAGVAAVALPADVAKLRDEQLEAENRARLEQAEPEPELYTGSADPGSIVGLDEFIPGGDTDEQ